MRGSLALAVVWVMGCGGERTPLAERTLRTAGAALSARQCDYFKATDGQPRDSICHATGSATEPYVILRLSEAGCLAHSRHEHDFISTTGDCGPNSCIPIGAPADQTERCCDGGIYDSATASCVPDPTLVWTTADSGPGSLRYVLSAVAPGATVTFLPSLAGKTITLASTISINSEVTIQGPAGASHVTLSGGGAVQILAIGGGVTVAMTGLNFTGGYSPNGGAIMSWGNLTITGSSFISNTAHENGGAIFNGGRLTVSASTFTSNTAVLYSGAAIGNWGTLTVDGSTFTSNTGYYGGAIFCWTGSGVTNVTNTTLFGNGSRQGQGGAVFVADGTTTLINVTASGTTGGPAVWVQNAGTIHVRNSLIAGNAGGDVVNPGWGGILTSLDYNLIGKSSGFSLAAHDRLGVDPMLGALGSNGGPTQTMLPASNSPAVNAIPAASCLDASGAPLTVDQRGDLRPAGASDNCTIGAVERQASDPP